MSASVPAPASILFINVSRIGDTLLATPAVRALKRKWPQARITFLGHPKRVEIVQNIPDVDATGPITKERAVWLGRLGGPRWDLAVVLGFDRPLVAYALRVAERVAAFKQGDAGLDSRLYRAVEPPGYQALHSAEVPLALTEALGVPAAGLRLAYVVTAEERARANARLAAAGIAGEPLVGFQVASFPTKAYRDWPLEHFAELGRRILARWPRAHLVFFGGEADARKTEALAARYEGKATSFAGKLSLRESAALMNELGLYVGVDTGPTHIAGALDMPMVALYHCYSPSRLLMPLERARCFPVDHPRGEGCGRETPMAEIAVDTVWEKVQEALR